MKYDFRYLTTMEKIDHAIQQFRNDPEVRLQTIYIDWDELHDVKMAFNTHTMKEWPHEFVKHGEETYSYYGVYLKYVKE